MPPVTGVLLNSVPVGRAGIASGAFNASRQAGGALAVAVFGALLAHQSTFTHGLRVSLLIAAAVALAAAGAAAALHTPGRAASEDGRAGRGVTGRGRDGSRRPQCTGDLITMTSWTPGQLGAIGAADELDMAAPRPDGTQCRLPAPHRHRRGRDRRGLPSKYGRYGPRYLDPMLAPGARATTVRLNPASPTTEGHQ